MLRGIISAINVDKSRKIKQIGFLFEEKEELEWIILTRQDVLSFNFSKLTRYFGDEDT